MILTCDKLGCGFDYKPAILQAGLPGAHKTSGTVHWTEVLDPALATCVKSTPRTRSMLAFCHQDPIMEFKLPRVHNISIEIDGRRFEGSWYVILRDMIVNYNGWTASTHERMTDADKVAVEMLRDLVREHYIGLDSLPYDLPNRIRDAAHNYVNAFDDDQPARALVSSFGESILDSDVHRQLSWLCVNAIGMIVPFWKSMCDSDTPESTYRELRRWLDDPSHSVDWASAQRPSLAMRDGERVADCDSCRLEPTADAVAKAAACLRTADPSLAVDVLLAAASAYDEGCYSEGSPDRFEKWLVFDALPRACRCEPLD